VTPAVDLSTDESSDDNPPDDQVPYEPRSSRSSTERKRRLSVLPKRCILDDPMFNAALERTKTSTRQALMIISPALAAAGVDVNQLSLSRTSFIKAHNDSRETLAAAVRQSFQPTVPLVAHFDGKLLANPVGPKRDCLPIVVSGLDVEKLLGIPMLPVGTGVMMGNKVVEFVRDWPGVEEHLAGLCFDTTASNTGIHAGAITVVQQAFNRRLLFLACRHHMLEICASAVFDAFFASKGPEIELFGRLKLQWDFIDKSKFDPFHGDEAGEGCLSVSENAWLVSHRDVVVSNLQQHLQDVQPREDYREFARLALRLLGVDIDPTSCAPGAYHRARWMAKGIYCLKIFGFRHQFHMSKREIESLRRICIFVCTIYVRVWFAAPLATSAPTNDLLMLQQIEDFQQVDSKIAGVAGAKMRLQLWYLSEDLASLPLFSDNISDYEKSTIVNALQKNPFPDDVRRVAPNKIPEFRNLSVAQFVTRRSLNLFYALRLPKEFLTAAVDTWSECANYISARKILRALKVVNDCAERAVKLATDFNEILTKNDEQRQLLYQVVEHDRKHLPANATKKQLVKSNT